MTPTTQTDPDDILDRRLCALIVAVFAVITVIAW
jgi:hypothetical protein